MNFLSFKRKERMNNNKYSSAFQSKTIASLLVDKDFLIQIHDILKPDIFDNKAREYILKEILDYYKEYKNTPSADVMTNIVNTIEDETLRSLVIIELNNVVTYANSKDLNFVKDKIIAFCRNQKIKQAIYDSVDLIKAENYDQIRKVIDEALKAGQNYNLGLDYFNEIDARYENAVRDVIPTPWDVVNEIIDGGVGKGELIAFVSSPGGGKCVGPNTEIDIEYEEIGIDIGNENIMWINPFDVFNIDDNVIYGWQVEKILTVCDMNMPG